MNKYIEGMKEIGASEAMKRQWAASGRLAAANRSRKSLMKKAALPAAVFAIVLLVVTCASLFQSSDHGKPLSAAFIITAYASDGSAAELKPNVQFPLGEYHVLLSSVPGFPLAIDSDEADWISVTAAKGSLAEWTPSTSKVNRHGKQADIKSGSKVYWSPITGMKDDGIAQSTKITIIAYKNKKELGRRVIQIESNASNGEIPVYTALLLDPN